MFRLIWQKKIALAFVVLLVLTLPVAITRPAEMLSKSIITTVGIEKQGDTYVVTGEVVVNQFNEFGGKFIEIISGEGENLNQAFNAISRTRGRTVSLAHCSLIILGSGLEEENIAHLLTFLLHRTEINNSCSLLWTDTDMETLLTLSKESADNRTNHLQQIAEFNRRNQFGAPATLQNFYKDYLRLSKTSLIPTVTIEDELIHNPNEVAVFTEGILKFKLLDEQTQALKFLQRHTIRHQITIPDIDADGKTLQATVEIQKKRARIRTRVESGIPNAKIRCRVRLKIVDIADKENPHAFLDLKSTDVPAEQIAKAFDQYVIGGLTDALSTIVAHNADFMQFSDRFWQMHRHYEPITEHLIVDFDVKTRIVN